MARLNLFNRKHGARTHEGAPARDISTELELRRSVLACLLWESQFYQDGVEIAGRIAELVPKVAPEKVAALAVEAREKMKLRHAPLLQVREMARHATHRRLERVGRRVHPHAGAGGGITGTAEAKASADLPIRERDYA